MKARAVALGVMLAGAAAACYHRTCHLIVVPATEADCAVPSQDPCAACLKAHCCAMTVAWINRAPDAGAELGPCVEAHCDAACTRPK